MKKVLIVTYHYPPSAAVGAIRPGTFVRYLPASGWEPVVLTTLADQPVQDEASPHVHRVNEWTHPLKWYARRSQRRCPGEGIGTRWHAPFESLQRPPSGIKGLILPFLRLPDEETGWLIPAVLRGVRLVRQERLAAMITTAPPFTSHLVGLLIKRLTGVAWIADYRDPWLVEHKVPLYRHRGSEWVERRLIERVLHEADRIVSVTQPMTEQVRKHAPHLPETKCVTVTGGYDPADFEPLGWSRPSPPPVIMSYLGTFYHGRSPEPFLRALAELLTEGRLFKSDIRVTFVGNVQYAEGRAVEEMVDRLGLTDIVTITGPVPRPEALRQSLESHVLLVLDERHPIQVPHKLYEALAAGAMILNIGGEGAVADVLARTGGGIAVHHGHHEGIKNAIVQCVEDVRGAGARGLEQDSSGGAPWTRPAIAAFDVRRIIANLALHLEAVTEDRCRV